MGRKEREIHGFYGEKMDEKNNWLVVWNHGILFIFSHILGIVTPTD